MHRLRLSDDVHTFNILHFAFCILHLLALRTAILLFVVLVFANISTAELQWRSSRAAAKKPSKPTSAQHFVQPRSQRRVDKAVRTAAFEDEGPQLTSR